MVAFKYKMVLIKLPKRFPVFIGDNLLALETSREESPLGH